MSTHLTHEVDEEQIPYHVDKSGEVPFWDHPLIDGYIAHPKKYYPYSKDSEVINHLKRNLLDKEDMMLLKVLGDAVCAHEDQLRRYASSKMSRSNVSKRLNHLRRNGFVYRWHVRIRGNEEQRPPAPFTLGIAGYKLLKHYYNHCYFMDPERWDSLGVGAIQRYVSMNEIRCRLVEAKAIRGWKWNAVINNDRRIRTALGVGEIITPNGEVNFFVERAQMSQNYIGFLRDKLHSWTSIFEKGGYLPVNDMESTNSTVIILASTLSIAEHIHSELLIDKMPMNTWICVEEIMYEQGLEHSFYRANGEVLEQIFLDFLAPKEN